LPAAAFIARRNVAVAASPWAAAKLGDLVHWSESVREVWTEDDGGPGRGMAREICMAAGRAFYWPSVDESRLFLASSVSVILHRRFSRRFKSLQ
jgi:hypothetical protein